MIRKSLRPLMLAAGLAAFLAAPCPARAQNPIVPPGVYIADPSAHVWKDGKMHVYGSRDESPKYYCSWDHWVLSSPDLLTWEIAKDAFASKGPNDQVACKYVDFGAGVGTVTVRVAPGPKPARIVLSLDQMWSAAIGTIDVPGGGDGKTWTTITAPVRNPGGVHALWLRFSGEGPDLLRVDSLQFGPDRRQRTVAATLTTRSRTSGRSPDCRCCRRRTRG